MGKVVLNGCFGGYELSKEAYEFLGLEWDTYGFAMNYDRENPKLIECVETLGKKASGSLASLYVEEYDDENFCYNIDEYDGNESLELFPIVNESKMQGKSVKQICDYLESLDIVVRRI